MKVALVHDYLYTYGGAERVLEALHEIWPEAPIYTAWVDWQWLKTQKPEWKSWKITTSWFDKIPFKKILCSPLRFLTPKIWSSLDLSDFDIVISSSAWYMSKGVSLLKFKVQSSKFKVDNPLHICYCHTPPRYLYGYPTAKNFERFWWGRMYARIINPFMRYYDFKSSETIDWFICNSHEVEKRINKFYRREAKVIYPPISIYNTRRQKTEDGKRKTEDYLLMVNRLVEPKNVDLAIKACLQLKINLKIVGSGPDENRLKNLANNSPYIEFLGYVDDLELEKLYKGSRAVLYLASEEDFGITPVEAMSFGKLVIALRSGGVQESIVEGETGLFMEKLEIPELEQAIKKLGSLGIRETDCINQAKKFSKERFKREIKDFVEQKYKKWHNR